MRRLLVVIGISLLFICHNTAWSQTVVITDGEMTFTDGSGETFYSLRSKTINLSSGYILKTASFKLPEDHPLVPEKGTRIVAVRYILSYKMDEDGNMVPAEFITDEKVDITHTGRFSISMHLNGAGNHLPIGWYDPSYYE